MTEGDDVPGRAVRAHTNQEAAIRREADRRGEERPKRAGGWEHCPGLQVDISHGDDAQLVGLPRPANGDHPAGGQSDIEDPNAEPRECRRGPRDSVSAAPQPAGGPREDEAPADRTDSVRFLI